MKFQTAETKFKGLQAGERGKNIGAQWIPQYGDIWNKRESLVSDCVEPTQGLLIKNEQ